MQGRSTTASFNLRRTIAQAVAFATSAVITGCSFLFVDAPPTDHATRAHFTCTTSRFHPIADIVWGASAGVGGLGQLAIDSDFDGKTRTTSALIYLGIAALFGASAYDGFNDVAECREALDQLSTRTRPAPMPYPAPYHAPAPVPEPGAAVGCLADAHCKAGMVCVQNQCVMPTPQAPTLAPVAPAPTPQPVPVTPAPVAPANPPPPSAPPAVDETPVLVFPAPP